MSEEARSTLAGKAESGDAAAQDTLGTFYVSICEGGKDPERGIALLQKAAHQGNAHAQYILAQAYWDGQGVARDREVAIGWYNKSSASGNAQAQNNLGLAYQSGESVNKDLARAAALFQSAAEQDLPEAAFNLAMMFDKGVGVKQDYAAARKWYQQAGERKEPDSEYRLAVMLDQGLGGEKAPAAAARWMKRAAEDGSTDAQIKLGLKRQEEAPDPTKQMRYEVAMALLDGKGGTADAARGQGILEELAASGYTHALFRLGRMYANGIGVAKDEAKGLDYYEQAIKKDPEDYTFWNNIAWIYVTTENPKLRNPQKALQYALRAVQLSGGKQPTALDTLAHAHFAAGDIDKAIETETKALSLKPDSELYQKALAEYRAAKEKTSKK